MPCERAANIYAEVRNLSCWGLAFLPLDGASRLLGPSLTISETIQMLFHLLADCVDPFQELFNWLQFPYTKDWAGDFMASASAVLAQSVVSEGDSLFSLAWRHHQKSYPGAYDPPAPPKYATSIAVPLGPAYSYYPPIGQDPDRGDMATCTVEGEKGGGGVKLRLSYCKYY